MRPEKLLRASIPAAFPEDGHKIRKAYIEYLRLIGDSQWQQRMNDLERYGFHRYWADYDSVAWGLGVSPPPRYGARCGWGEHSLSGNCVDRIAGGGVSGAEREDN